MCTEDNALVFLSQEDDTFMFYNRLRSEINDLFVLSSAYGHEYVPSSKHVVLYSFEGEIVVYDYLNKKVKNTKQIKNSFDDNSSCDCNGNVSNPPYLNKIIYNYLSPQTNEIFCALMNGLLISISATNLKKKKLKTIHNGSVSDIKLSKFQIKSTNNLITYGKDKHLKFISTSDFNINYYIEMEQVLIDYDSVKNDNKVVYVNNTSKSLFYMDIKS